MAGCGAFFPLGSAGVPEGLCHGHHSKHSISRTAWVKGMCSGRTLGSPWILSVPQGSGYQAWLVVAIPGYLSGSH